jgi:hypothetical protein
VFRTNPILNNERGLTLLEAIVAGALMVSMGYVMMSQQAKLGELMKWNDQRDTVSQKFIFARGAISKACSGNVVPFTLADGSVPKVNTASLTAAIPLGGGIYHYDTSVTPAVKKDAVVMLNQELAPGLKLKSMALGKLRDIGGNQYSAELSFLAETPGSNFGGGKFERTVPLILTTTGTGSTRPLSGCSVEGDDGASAGGGQDFSHFGEVKPVSILPRLSGLTVLPGSNNNFRTLQWTSVPITTDVNAKGATFRVLLKPGTEDYYRASKRIFVAGPTGTTVGGYDLSETIYASDVKEGTQLINRQVSCNGGLGGSSVGCVENSMTSYVATVPITVPIANGVVKLNQGGSAAANYSFQIIAIHK